ncbi:MAG: hypothetical protein Q8S57_10035 [Methanoregula sp.]|nr:hypothetical protein [Methanoregula sp.]
MDTETADTPAVAAFPGVLRPVTPGGSEDEFSPTAAKGAMMHARARTTRMKTRLLLQQRFFLVVTGAGTKSGPFPLAGEIVSCSFKKNGFS